MTAADIKAQRARMDRLEAMIRGHLAPAVRAASILADADGRCPPIPEGASHTRIAIPSGRFLADPAGPLDIPSPEAQAAWLIECAAAEAADMPPPAPPDLRPRVELIDAPPRPESDIIREPILQEDPQDRYERKQRERQARAKAADEVEILRRQEELRKRYGMGA